MLRRFVAGLLALVIIAQSCAPASAWVHGAPPPTGNQNKAQINVGRGDLSTSVFLNALKSCGSVNLGSNSPSVFDINLYPVSALNSLISCSLSTLPSTGPWVLAWPSTRTLWKLNILSSGATCANQTGSPTIGNCSGGTTSTISPQSGVAGSVEITFATTAAPTIRWDNSGTFGAGTGEITLVRKDQLALYNAGQIFTPAFESALAGTKAGTLRVMGWSEQSGAGQPVNEVAWAYRTQPTAFSWGIGVYPPNAWSSSITVAGTSPGQIGQFTASPATDTPLSGWVANEVLLGPFPSVAGPMTVTGAAAATGTFAGNVKLTVSAGSNLLTNLAVGQSVKMNFIQGTTEANGVHTILSLDDATHFTIDVTFVNAYSTSGTVSYQTLAVTGKSGGAKFIVANNAFSPSVSSGTGTVFYDAVLDSVVYFSGGINSGPPVEAMVQLANREGMNLWYNIPPYASDDYIQQSLGYIFGNLTSVLFGKIEYGNENWNGKFVSTQWMTARGLALGIAPSFNASPYEGYRIRQIFGNVYPKVANMLRLYEYQATLIPTGSMTGSTLSAFGYNTKPQRPIDFVDRMGGAPYVSGLGLTGNSDDVNNGGLAPSIYDKDNLQPIINNRASGNISAAISGVDALIRNGRNRVQNVTASGTLFSTPLVHNLAVNDRVRFDVSGGTAYSGLNLKQMYQVLTTSTAGCAGAVICNFTAAPVVNGSSTGAAVNAGSAGTGTMTVGYTGKFDTPGQSIFNIIGWEPPYWQATLNGISPAPLNTILIEEYEGALEPSPNTPVQLAAIGVTAPNTASFTGTLTAGSTTITGLSSTAGLVPGMTLVATGISNNIVINAINIGASSLTVTCPLFSGCSGSGTWITGSGSTSIAADDAFLQLQLAVNTDFKFDNAASATMQVYYNGAIGADPNAITYQSVPSSVGTSNLVLLGGGEYALISGPLPTDTPYQTYYGFCAFSSGAPCP